MRQPRTAKRGREVGTEVRDDASDPVGRLVGVVGATSGMYTRSLAASSRPRGPADTPMEMTPEAVWVWWNLEYVCWLAQEMQKHLNDPR